MTLTVGSLFSGIGGLDLGLERAGMRVRWQVECDEYARKVLRKHWPEVPCYPDVRTVGAAELEPVDILCGGFPCQDISNAGKRAGIEGERSGLWSEFFRLICEVRPRFVLVENVSALLARGVGRVLGDLAESGMDAEWDCLPASLIGGHQRRERVFVVAYRHGERQQASRGVFDRDACKGELAKIRKLGRLPRLERGRGGRVWPLPDAGIHGVADVPAVWVDRLRCLGNAVVPQVAEFVGRRIVAMAEAA